MTLKTAHFLTLSFCSLFFGFAKAQPVVKIDGSSSVFPISEGLAENFQTEQKGKIRVTVGISGTGGGFKKFCRGETDVQNASRPILAEEMKACKEKGIKYFEVPIAFDALTVVVNPKNDWVNELSIEELKIIWAKESEAKIIKWKQIKSDWPDENLRLYGAGSDSGTFDYFTEAVNGKAKVSRGDYTQSEDDNTLVQGVSSSKFALGYVPYSYYDSNRSKLKAVAIKSDAKSKAVLPNAESVKSGKYNPLSRPLFIYISEKAYKEASHVRAFVDFALNNAAAISSEVGYVALPEKAYQIGKEHLAKSKLGTAFGGRPEVGLNIEEILKRESTL